MKRYNPLNHQPDIIFSKKEKRLLFLRHFRSHLSLFYYFVKGLPKTALIYKKRSKSLYSECRIPDGFCLSTDNDPELLEKIQKEMISLRPDSLLIRIPVWTLDSMKYTIAFLKEINRMGFDIIIEIIQDDESIKDIKKWGKAVNYIFSQSSDYCCKFVIGHAWNRKKWVVYSVDNYLSLFETAYNIRNYSYPHIKLIGPSVIDFEYINTLGCLNHKRKPLFDIVNQFLYVDRRGAPENKQNGFDLSHKCLLFRSITDATLGENVPFWITETNYPLKTENLEYCPTSQTEAITEDLYASYMVRYYLIALFSGFVERIYWWQIAAHGYGLIDNINGSWRRRRAYYAFSFMKESVKNAMLKKKTIDKDHYNFHLKKEDGSGIIIAWSLKKEMKLKIDMEIDSVFDITGNEISKERIILSNDPIYILLK